jgi:hypothetical protein
MSEPDSIPLGENTKLTEAIELKELQTQAETYSRISNLVSLAWTFGNDPQLADLNEPELVAKMVDNMKTNWKMPDNKDGLLSDDYFGSECRTAIRIFKEYKKNCINNPYIRNEGPEVRAYPRWEQVMADTSRDFEDYSHRPDLIIKLLKETKTHSFIEAYLERKLFNISLAEDRENEDFNADLGSDKITPIEDLDPDVRELQDSAQRLYATYKEEDAHYLKIYIDSFRSIYSPEIKSQN